MPHAEVQQSSLTLPKKTKEKTTSSLSPQSRYLRCMKGKPSLSLKVNEKEYSTYLPYSSSYNSVYFIFRFVNVMGLVGHLNGEHSCAIDSVERTFGSFYEFYT